MLMYSSDVIQDKVDFKSKQMPIMGASQVALVVKNPPANAGDTGDSGLIPEGLQEEEMATRSSILAWRIPWTEKLCGLQSTG